MKVLTQMGILDINPESVVAVRRAPVMPESMEFSDLTHCIEFDDRFYSMDGNVVCISEGDAEKLAELAGVEIEGRRAKPEEPRPETTKKSNRATIFVPFNKQIILNEWGKNFDENIAWRCGKFLGQDKEPEPAPSSPSSNGTMQAEEKPHSGSLIEQAFNILEKRSA